MGACCSCCFDGPKPYSAFGRAAETPEDREARLRAAERAEERQKTFEQSAVGRAAYKSVAEAKRPETRPVENTNARDWQS